VRKALSAVARTHNRFGLQAAVKLLAGLPDPRLERSGLQATKTFGAFKGRSEDWLLSLLRRCVTAGWVDFTAGERPMVLLTPAGKAVLFAEGPVRLLLPPEHAGKKAARPAGSSGGRGRAAAPSMTPADGALFEALRARRLELARADGVPPYVVASDRTLRELAELRPTTKAALEGVFGIGPAKAAKYGDDFLAVVRHAG
jgi:ATP-dependent DNA helicase RecQ